MSSAGNGQSNGQSNWKQLADTFFAGHMDAAGKRLPFTPTFNTMLDSLITHPGIPLEWRVLFWVLRKSWGNYRDSAVSEKGEEGYYLGQKDCCTDLGEEKQRVSESVAYLRNLGYLVDDGRKLTPVDQPQILQKVRYVPDKKGREGEEFVNWWKVRNASDFEQFRVRRAAYFEALRVRSVAYLEYEAERTTADPILISEDHKSFSNTEGESSSSAVLSVVQPEKSEEEVPPPATFATLKRLYPRKRFDEGKTKPLFEVLKPKQRAEVISQLHVYLACEKWADRNGQWIPLCSNWLKSYAAAPSPLLRKHDAAREKLEQQAERIEKGAKLANLFRHAGGVM